MDFEKMAQFILDLQAKNEQRWAQSEQRWAQNDEHLSRLVTVVEALADHVRRLDRTIETLAEAQLRNEERFRQTDERIAKLVSAIGEITRHLPQQR